MAAIIAEAQNEAAEADPWPANALETEIRDTIAAFQAIVFSAPGGSTTDNEAAMEEMMRLEKHLDALEAKLPATAQTVSQVISKAELAWFWADKELSDELTAIVEDEDCADVASARLIVAVLQFAGLGSRYKVEA